MQSMDMADMETEVVMGDTVGMEVMEVMEDSEDVVVTEEGAPMAAVVQIIMEEDAEGAALMLVRRWMLKLMPILITNIAAY